MVPAHVCGHLFPHRVFPLLAGRLPRGGPQAVCLQRQHARGQLSAVAAGPFSVRHARPLLPLRLLAAGWLCVCRLRCALLAGWVHQPGW